MKFIEAFHIVNSSADEKTTCEQMEFVGCYDNDFVGDNLHYTLKHHSDNSERFINLNESLSIENNVEEFQKFLEIVKEMYKKRDKVGSTLTILFPGTKMIEYKTHENCRCGHHQKKIVHIPSFYYRSYYDGSGSHGFTYEEVDPRGPMFELFGCFIALRR